jgi:hypothetical protein
MPKAKRKSREKKRWYTYAYMTREGAPAPGHFNFVRHYGQASIMLEDLAGSMRDERFHKGAYALAIWPGEIDEWEALHGNTKPVYYMYQGGSVEKLGKT